MAAPIPDQVYRALLQIGVDARFQGMASADWSKQGHVFFISIAQGPISGVQIIYSPAMPVEGSFEEWDVSCVVRGRERVVPDFWAGFYPAEHTWTNPSRLKPVWIRLEEKARKILETPEPQTKIETFCSALQELGIGVRVCRHHTIEIFEGPIRWIEFGLTDPDYDTDQYSISWLVPDPRIGADFPKIAIRSVRGKKFPLIEPVKEVRWEPYDDEDFEDIKVTQRDLDFNSYVADRLIQREDVTTAIISDGKDIRISVDPEERHWLVGKEWGLSAKPLADRASRYECFQAVAKALLAMSMPESENAPEAN